MQTKLFPPELRYKLARWNDGKKIDWFFNKRLSSWLMKSIDVQMREKQFYVAFYLMLLTIEVLSGFLEGKRTSMSTFCTFMRRYFSNLLAGRAPNPVYHKGVAHRGLNPKQKITFVEILWIYFRYGLAERCMIYPRISLVERSRYYCKYYKRAGLRLDIQQFYKDFLSACRIYCDDVYGDYLVRQKFIKRFNRVS